MGYGKNLSMATKNNITCSTIYTDQCRLNLLSYAFIHETVRLVKHKSLAQVFRLALPHSSTSRS